MKDYKNWFWISTFLLLVWFSSIGCVTKAVWEDKHTSTPYNETILAFYTDAKTNNIAFIGEKFHYIFDKQTKEFIELLKNKDFLNLKKENLRINASVSQSDIQTDISVTFDLDKINKKQNLWLTSHNYREVMIPPPPHSQIGVKVYMKHYHINGKRYLVDSKVNAVAYRLKRAIGIRIMEHKVEKGNLAKKIALTPLSVTADAVGSAIVLAGAVVLLPVGLLASIFD
jgi:hypothetical protein